MKASSYPTLFLRHKVSVHKKRTPHCQGGPLSLRYDSRLVYLVIIFVTYLVATNRGAVASDLDAPVATNEYKPSSKLTFTSIVKAPWSLA